MKIKIFSKVQKRSNFEKFYVPSVLTYAVALLWQCYSNAIKEKKVNKIKKRKEKKRKKKITLIFYLTSHKKRLSHF